MSGAERVLLHHLAVETGLRAYELWSLTLASFDFLAKPSIVTVAAAHSKRRRNDTLPLRAALVKKLRPFLATKLPEAKVFSMPERWHVAKMFRANLEAANIAYVDESGRFADFHCLRHGFVSHLAASGVHPKTSQQFARHSTISLTMDRYTHTLRGADAEALAVMPDLDRPPVEELRATGTDGNASKNSNGSVLAFCLARNQNFEGTLGDYNK
jgi:integrase